MDNKRYKNTSRRYHGGEIKIGSRGGYYVKRHGRRIYLGNRAYKSKRVREAEAPAKYRL